jgi:mitochondrial import inner membrane translocase subunit TIM44
VQTTNGYRHLNNRKLSVFNEFSMQIKGEAKRYVVKEDLKVR